MGQARGERGDVREEEKEERRKRKEERGKARMGERGRTGVFQMSRTLEDDENEEVVMETMFSFEAFEVVSLMRYLMSPELLIVPCFFRNSQIPRSRRPCLLTSPDTMNSNLKRIANLLHRQAIRAKAEGLFFNVCFSVIIPSSPSNQTLTRSA